MIMADATLPLRDFTVEAYDYLVAAFARDFRFVTMAEYITAPSSLPSVVFRHDVDRDVPAAVRCARILAHYGQRGTFYFRYPYTFRPSQILQIAGLGHEIGYHYETLSKAAGDVSQAIRLFEQELAELRAVAPVRTACMHGSPLSRWDNRAIWKTAKLSDFGLLGEPYLSIDYGRVLYLTDTGRSWNGARYSIRDRVTSPVLRTINSTKELAFAALNGGLHDQVVLTVHPERWSAKYSAWLWQLLWQTTKNLGKAIVIRARRAG